ncbi:UDP-2,3-diacylglucosamine diphosphatase [Lacimicrobium alkaliphilum]|uniref:UDP-2,3-diacylglucosamine hydrolase n=1 Tax=Lacimicrobium alkaliphilum TaxID=1526571 RepID=A0A0U3B297_9ALTE|nr:UDP-2,3-diacylglucosamine diphosphatase [Lacimicrobium alkaliphilum]ALS99184.1 UDP-2,3-diacylglucosamine hydrolase [Lacimicrobium alkaliphilum]
MTHSAHYRTLWLSDIHLGYKDCKAEYLLDFLDHCRVDTLYLVGDIVDMWAMSRQFMWPKAHNQLFHRLLSLSREGTRVIYLPGNHDEPIQKYDGMAFGDIEIHRQYVHTTADGRKLLLMHGDQFDQEVCFGPMHAWIGDKAYDLLLFTNRWYNRLRTAMGYPYWSLAGYIKSRIKGANEAIARYRDIGCRVAREMGMDGIVCGHIHHPEILQQQEILYCNTGDWIENCSALTEDRHGCLQLVYWTAQRGQVHHLSKPAKSQKAA